MTDREILIALFNAVGALSERLIGEKLLLCVEKEDGHFEHVYANPSNVTWIKQEGLEAHVADQKEWSAMRCPLHVSPDSIQPKSPQAVGRSASHLR